jgi:hypothetical protein
MIRPIIGRTNVLYYQIETFKRSLTEWWPFLPESVQAGKSIKTKSKQVSEGPIYSAMNVFEEQLK